MFPRSRPRDVAPGVEAAAASTMGHDVSLDGVRVALREGPRNLVGERPARTALEVAERLRGKMRELRGGANRSRAAAEAERVLDARSATARAGRARTPQNEEGEPPTRSRQETTERLVRKLRGLHGTANRRRVETKTISA